MPVTESIIAQAKLPTLLGMLLQTTVQLAYKQWVCCTLKLSGCYLMHREEEAHHF